MFRCSARRCFGELVAACLVLAVFASLAWAQAASPPQDQAQAAQEAEMEQAVDQTTQTTETKPAEAKKPAHFVSKAWGVKNETEPPNYVKPFSEYGFPGTADLKWLDFGVEHRTRYEHRDDDYRQPFFEEEDIFLMRSRAYLGIREVLDPLRLGFEFQDARQFNTDFPERGGDVDEADILQAFLELYFKDAMGPGQPLQLRAGRMTLEYTDRHLVGRNRWRNATNAYDGFRLRMGEPSSDWQFDFFAAQPVERFLRKRDHGDDERWLYGIVGAWRRWSKYVTFEPYYFILDEDRKDRTAADREIHTMGLRAFGPIAETRFDYDTDVAFQFGDDGDNEQRSWAAMGEVGYTFEHSWQPRLSLGGMYASGDPDSRNSLSERFARLYDPGHPYSSIDYLTWQNVIRPELRLELKPTDKLRFDTSYSAYWLAADEDAWVVSGRRDTTGRSGDFIGQEIDIRFRYLLDPRVEIEVGYAYFIPGPFVENTGPADDSNLLYVSTTLHL